MRSMSNERALLWRLLEVDFLYKRRFVFLAVLHAHLHSCGIPLAHLNRYVLRTELIMNRRAIWGRNEGQEALRNLQREDT